MNMEQCLILHYYGSYLKRTPSLCAVDCYFLSSVWMEPAVMLTRALKSLSWDEAENAKGGCNETENTRGGVWDQSGERGVVRRVQK